jgi:hypothetical protein
MDVSKVGKYVADYEEVKRVFNASTVYAGTPQLLKDIDTVESLFNYAQTHMYTKRDSQTL